MAGRVRITKPDGTVVEHDQTDGEVRRTIDKGHKEPRHLSRQEMYTVSWTRRKYDADSNAIEKWARAGFSAGVPEGTVEDA